MFFYMTRHSLKCLNQFPPQYCNSLSIATFAFVLRGTLTLSERELSLTAINKVDLVARSAVGVTIANSSWCLGLGIDGRFEDLLDGSMGHDSRVEVVGGDEGSIVLIDLDWEGMMAMCIVVGIMS